MLTIGGVLLGAGATYTATTFTERAKWQRSHDTRWDDKRLIAYMEYANALKRYVRVVYRLAAASGYPTNSEPIDLEDGKQALAEAAADRSVKWETVLLLGSPQAVGAARKWHEAAWKFRSATRGGEVDHDAYYRHYRELTLRRDEFYACARADLGVNSGALPPSNRDPLPAVEVAIDREST
ncbi:hypothetical protein [Nocardia suismassiliense]|uniref:hypothetical protein n=1 Tax=Nocardia suismassiliense TaxID=2077092 RepID=UPI001F2EAD3D|nr:hypothetical protein [Nocardia suismassiliense]